MRRRGRSSVMVVLRWGSKKIDSSRPVCSPGRPTKELECIQDGERVVTNKDRSKRGEITRLAYRRCPHNDERRDGVVDD